MLCHTTRMSADAVHTLHPRVIAVAATTTVSQSPEVGLTEDILQREAPNLELSSQHKASCWNFVTGKEALHAMNKVTKPQARVATKFHLL